MVGSIILLIALAFSVSAMVLYYLTFKGDEKKLNYARLAYHIMAMLVITASAWLWYLLLSHQYQFKYVYSYSNNSLSTGFLISTFWGGQEGSFMLWLLLTSIVGIVLQSYAQKRGDLEPRVMMVFTLSTTFLLIMVSPLFKNPFEYLWAEPIFVAVKDINPAMFNLPLLQNFLFNDPSTGQNLVKINSDLYNTLASNGVSINDLVVNGKGLNPQLLNFWMQIHPPILFTGFAMATVPYVFAVAALLKNEYKEWVKHAFPWVLAGSGILGLGIMLGGYWAYEMLGWGGYWAWDPVENSSLIPWLVGVASIHTLLVQKRSQKNDGPSRFAKTNLILSLLTYVLVLYSTFLTRSGVLGDASVHAFVDPGKLVYLFLVIFISTFILLGAGLMIWRRKELTKIFVAEESLLSRELALFTGSVALCASAIIVLIGTSAPLFKVSVDSVFYNEMNLPIAIIIGIANGVSLLLKWKTTKKEEFVKRISIFSVASFLFTIIISVFAGISDIMIILLILSAIFTIIVNGDIAIKVVKGNKKMLGAYISHIGIALFLLGVVGSAGFTKEKDMDLKLNKPQEAFGYKMEFTGITPIENNTKYKFNIKIEKGESQYTISPVMYMSDFNNSLMREPAILNLMAKDIYISPLGYDEPSADNFTHVQMKKGNTTKFEDVELTFDKYEFTEEQRAAMQAGKEVEIGVDLSAEFKGKKTPVRLALIMNQGQQQFTSVDLKDANIKIQLIKLDAEGNIEVGFAKLGEQTQAQPVEPVLTVQTSIKPMISLVWIGVLVMVIGFAIAAVRRLKESLV